MQHPLLVYLLYDPECFNSAQPTPHGRVASLIFGPLHCTLMLYFVLVLYATNVVDINSHSGTAGKNCSIVPSLQQAYLLL